MPEDNTPTHLNITPSLVFEMIGRAVVASQLALIGCGTLLWAVFGLWSRGGGLGMPPPTLLTAWGLAFIAGATLGVLMALLFAILTAAFITSDLSDPTAYRWAIIPVMGVLFALLAAFQLDAWWVAAPLAAALIVVVMLVAGAGVAAMLAQWLLSALPSDYPTT